MRYLKYVSAQLKRTLRLAVGIFPTAMLLFACLGAAVYFFFQQGPMAEGKQKYQIGVVGKIDDTYLGFGIYAIQTLDSSRFMADFLPMTEDEAKAAFRSGDLVAYIIVPEEFLDSIIYGRNDVPIQYVTTEGGKGIGDFVMDELAVVASELVTSSQCAIYSMQEIAYELGETAELRDWTDEINLRLIGYVLGRSGLVEVEELGFSKGLMVKQYYFCAILVLFCFLLGISSAPLFLRKNGDLGKWMKMRGIGPTAQVLSEFFPYFLLILLCIGVPLLILNAITGHFGFLESKVWTDELFKALIPVAFLACAMHFCIYETIKNPVANLLFMFLGILGMGYVSGLIYPSSFFPKGIAAVGKVLPTGVSLEYLSGTIFRGSGLEPGSAERYALLYGITFIVISILSRRWTIMKENG